MKNATIKQINYILKLSNDYTREELEKKTCKQASWIIHELLTSGATPNTKQQEQKQEKQIETITDLLKTINWDELKKKYNAFMTYGYQETSGPVVYNDHNGANCHSELLKDMRKFKSYLNKLIKEEFHGLLNFKISARTSRHWACSDEVIITVTASKDLMCKTFAELERVGKVHDALCNFWAYRNDNAKSRKAIHAYYKYHAIYNVKNDMLKPEWQNLKDFLESLLNSFSYDHNDIMTDYFDSGLYWRVDMKTEEEQEDWESVENFFSFNFDNEEAILAKYPVSEEEHEEAEQDATIEEIPEEKRMYLAAAMACKPCNIQEINKWQENERTYYITHLVKFTKQETWDNFKNNLLKDWGFLNQPLGGWDFVNADTKQPLPDAEQEQAWDDFQKGTLSDNINIRNHAILAIGPDNVSLIIDPSGSSYCRYAGLCLDMTESTVSTVHAA